MGHILRHNDWKSFAAKLATPSVAGERLSIFVDGRWLCRIKHQGALPPAIGAGVQAAWCGKTFPEYNAV